MELPKPTINDQFWFDYSAELVKGSISRLDSALGVIKKFITGLLTVYTASAIFTIEYKDIKNPLLLVLFALPYIVVLFGKWHTTVSSIPKSADFDPRVPSKIKKAYMSIHEFKERQLKISVFISFIATLLIATTLMLGFIIGNKKIQEEKAKKEYYLETDFDKEHQQILVTGYFPASSKIKIRLTHFFKKDTIQSKPLMFLNSNTGQFFNAIKMDTIGIKTKVYLEWEDEKQNQAIIKEVSTK
ncbi:hypothetical protein ACFLS4_05515 [Bacteroidota bacterium]